MICTAPLSMSEQRPVTGRRHGREGGGCRGPRGMGDRCVRHPHKPHSSVYPLGSIWGLCPIHLPTFMLLSLNAKYWEQGWHNSSRAQILTCTTEWMVQISLEVKTRAQHLLRVSVCSNKAKVCECLRKAKLKSLQVRSAQNLLFNSNEYSGAFFLLPNQLFDEAFLVYERCNIKPTAFPRSFFFFFFPDFSIINKNVHINNKQKWLIYHQNRLDTRWSRVYLHIIGSWI